MYEANTPTTKLTPREEARKDVERSIRGYDLLDHLNQLLDNPQSKVIQDMLIADMEEIVQAFVESGGTASEILTRLQGLGIIKDFPQVKQLSTMGVNRNGSRPNEFLGSKLELVTTEDGNKQVNLKLFFFASPIDKDTKKETWNHAYATAFPFVTDMHLKVPQEGLTRALEYFKNQKSEALNEYKKYPAEI